MKRSVSLLALLFITIFAFGQNDVRPDIKKSGNLLIDKHLKGFETDKHFNQIHFFQKDKISDQSFGLNSSIDLKQRLDSLVSIGWEEEKGEWYPTWKDEYSYDDNGKVIRYLGYAWDDVNNRWEISEKEEYNYDASGNLSESLFYDWDEFTSQWILEGKEEFTLDAGGNLIQSTDYRWDDGLNQWIYTHKSEYSYDANGKLIQFVYNAWDEEAGQWIPRWKGEYTYDANGKLILDYEYEWDDMSGQWVMYGKDEYSYDANGNLTEEMCYTWDDLYSQWIRSDKYTYTYDVTGNITQTVYYEWNDVYSQWEPFMKEEFTHDNAFPYSSLILPYDFDDVSMYFTHKLDSLILFGWDEEHSVWWEAYISVLHYSEQDIGAVVELGAENILIYPNPVANYFSVHYSGNTGKVIIELFDNQGRKIFSGEVLNDERIFIDGLNSGMYFYKLYTTDGNPMLGKLMKY